MSLYYLNVTLHVLAAMLWLGGMFFFGLVGAPALRTVEPAAMRQQLFRDLGLRFRRVGWWAIGVLLLTGVGNLYFRGWLTGGVLESAAFWQTRLGMSLAAKLTLVGLMVGLSALHDFWLGPRASRYAPGSDAAAAARRTASIIARVNALLGILLIAVAVRLPRGG